MYMYKHICMYTLDQQKNDNICYNFVFHFDSQKNVQLTVRNVA